MVTTPSAAGVTVKVYKAPLPTNEEKRRQLQAKLATQKSLGGQMPGEKDDFFTKKKEKFLQQMQSKGYDFF